jgi:hypothetical protein
VLVILLLTIMSDRPRSELQRDRSQDQYHDAKAQVMKKILDEINSATKRREKPEKSFICYEDLKRIWSDQSRISTLLQPDRLPEGQIHFIQGHMIIILSTLISAGALECITNFRARLFGPNSGNAHLTTVEFHLRRINSPFLIPAQSYSSSSMTTNSDSSQLL